jgi:hypothetical protein
MSSRLGLYRLVQMPGGHEVIFSDPNGLADKIIEAGRDKGNISRASWTHWSRSQTRILRVKAHTATAGGVVCGDPP